MNIIIPMAGRGTRLRPHTLTIPKPLIPVAGKPIVERLVEDLAKACNTDIGEIAFIIGEDFGAQVEADLMDLAGRIGAKGHIFYQREKLGTAHAILCAESCLTGNAIVAFADTLFDMDTQLDLNQDGALWVQRVKDPSAYGVVTVNEEGFVSEFVEKPKTFVSDMAIIGIYYFKDADFLRKELRYLIDNDIQDRGEYQITDALENMKSKGVKFVPQPIKEWLDCGNKKAIIHANQRVLDIKKDANVVAESAMIENSVIIEPCFIGEGASIKNSVVGPYVSVGKGSSINSSVIAHSVIQNQSSVCCAMLDQAMLGNHAQYTGRKASFSLGDYSKFDQ